jgi:hypothetical protein
MISYLKNVLFGPEDPSLLAEEGLSDLRAVSSVKGQRSNTADRHSSLKIKLESPHKLLEEAKQPRIFGTPSSKRKTFNKISASNNLNDKILASPLKATAGMFEPRDFIDNNRKLKTITSINL